MKKKLVTVSDIEREILGYPEEETEKNKADKADKPDKPKPRKPEKIDEPKPRKLKKIDKSKQRRLEWLIVIVLGIIAIWSILEYALESEALSTECRDQFAGWEKAKTVNTEICRETCSEKGLEMINISSGVTYVFPKGTVPKVDCYCSSGLEASWLSCRDRKGEWIPIST